MILFVGGPWHGRAEETEPLSLIRVAFYSDSDYDNVFGKTGFVDYCWCNYATRWRDSVMRIRVWTVGGKPPEVSELLDAMMRVMHRGLGQEIGIEEIVPDPWQRRYR